jgi:hypothetical protein
MKRAGKVFAVCGVPRFVIGICVARHQHGHCRRHLNSKLTNGFQWFAPIWINGAKSGFSPYGNPRLITASRIDTQRPADGRTTESAALYYGCQAET